MYHFTLFTNDDLIRYCSRISLTAMKETSMRINPNRCLSVILIIDIYILLDGLVCSIMGYFYDPVVFWQACRASQNTRDEEKYPMILHSKPSNKKFIIQLEEFKIELSINVHTCLLITRMRDRLTWVQFLHTLNIADLSEMKTYQAGLLIKSIFFKFLLGLRFLSSKHLPVKQRSGVTNNWEAYDGLLLT